MNSYWSISGKPFYKNFLKLIREEGDKMALGYQVLKYITNYKLDLYNTSRATDILF